MGIILTACRSDVAEPGTTETVYAEVPSTISATSTFTHHVFRPTITVFHGAAAGLPANAIGVPVATYAFAIRNLASLRCGQIEVAEPGLVVRRSPAFCGDPTGRVYDGEGSVYTCGNDAGCITVYWKDFGDRTTWTRASDGVFDVITVKYGC